MCLLSPLTGLSFFSSLFRFSPSLFLHLLLCPPTLGGHEERFVARWLLAVTTFCGFWHKKEFQFRIPSPRYAVVTATSNVKCLLFLFFARGESSDYIELHSEAERCVSRCVALAVKSPRHFLWELAMMYDALSRFIFIAWHIPTDPENGIFMYV